MAMPIHCRTRCCRWNCRISRLSPVSFDPDDPDSAPSPPLNKAGEWVHVDLDLATACSPTPRHQRDAAVGGRSWYELRYADPQTQSSSAPGNEAYWMVRVREHGRMIPAGWISTSAGRTRGAASAVFAFLAQGALRPRPRNVRERTASGEPGLYPAFAYTTPRLVCTGGRRRRARRQVLPTGADGEVEVFQEFGKIGKSLKNRSRR